MTGTFQSLTSCHVRPANWLQTKLSLIPLFLLLAFGNAYSQKLPDTIRGYKVHRGDLPVVVSVDPAESADIVARSANAFVTVGEPKVVEIGISGISLELLADIRPINQSGKVDFLVFHELRVDGILVKAEEYDTRFEFSKNEPFSLPVPARVFIPTERIIQAAWKEMTESKDEWVVTGRIFVFGKFRKFGFYHKRVIPIDIEVTMKNPLR